MVLDQDCRNYKRRDKLIYILFHQQITNIDKINEVDYNKKGPPISIIYGLFYSLYTCLCDK